MAEWLAQLPADRPLVLGAAAAAAVLVVFRLLAAATQPGRRLVTWLHAVEDGVLALLLAAMIGFSFLQIVLRNAADSGFVWIDPLLRHLVLWIGFLGALLATRVGRHIQVDALSRALPPPVLRWTRLLTNLLSAAVCLLLCNACFKMVRDEASFATTGFLDVPVWMLQAVMPAALWLMAYRFAAHAVFDLRRGAGVSPSTREVAS